MQRHDLRNIALNAAGEALWGLQAGLVASATVLTVLLRRLGANEAQIGLIPALEGGLLVSTQTAGAWLFTSQRNRRRQLVIWHWAGVTPFFLLSALVAWAAPHLPQALVRWALMGSFGCCNLMVGMIIAVWLDWLAHLFSIRYRGMVMGISFFSAAVLSAGGSLAAGRLLALRPGVATYGLLYGAAGIIAALSMLCFWLIDDPAEREPDVIARPSLPLLLDRFRASLADRNFRAFLVGRVLSVAGFCMLPFVAVHYQSAAGGGLTAAAVVANGAALTLGTALAHLALGWLGDRRGHRAGILVGATAQVATLAAALALPGAWGCRLTYALAGVCASAGWLSHSNLVIESCPHDHRLAHISVANLVVGLPMLALPPLAGLAARAWGLRTLFAASLGFSVLSALWYVLRVRDPRDYSLLDRVPPSRCHSTR